jgi:hypothetical protein
VLHANDLRDALGNETFPDAAQKRCVEEAQMHSTREAFEERKQQRVRVLQPLAAGSDTDAYVLAFAAASAAQIVDQNSDLQVRVLR